MLISPRRLEPVILETLRHMTLKLAWSSYGCLVISHIEHSSTPSQVIDISQYKICVSIVHCLKGLNWQKSSRLLCSATIFSSGVTARRNLKTKSFAQREWSCYSIVLSLIPLTRTLI